jgi:hypothetical protein
MRGSVLFAFLRNPRSSSALFVASLALLTGWAAALPAMAEALPANCSPSGSTVTCTFSSTGAEQSFVVPSGVSSIAVLAVGGEGGAGGGNNGNAQGGAGGAGGFGDQVAGNLAVTGGTTLYVEVGGNGATGSSSNGCDHTAAGGSGGFNGGASGGSATGDGGGGGGGASDIRTVSVAQSDTTLASRLVVAAGGGGGGGCEGGVGGTAGGAGVGAQGGGGGAGTASAGGAGGAAAAGGTPGSSGDLAMGGPGGGGYDGGGGGGGGDYGGGGGGGNHDSTLYGGGGGGGGSSYAGSLTGSAVTLDSSGTPEVVISYSTSATLTVARAGHGSGTVTSSPVGISCGSTCLHAYAGGTAVTLTARAARGSRFAGWSGACSGTGSCKLTMNGAETVTASFAVVPPPNTLLTNDAISNAKRRATFDFTGSGGVAPLRYQCRLDSGSWQSCTSPKSYTGLSRGSHTFRVRAVDARGEADPTPATHSFTI